MAVLLGGTSLLALTVQAGAQAVLPQGASVASGQVRIGTPSGNSLSISQTSSRAVVDWNSFSVGANASVNFVQPGAGSAILNRVTGTTSSTIAGQITANGQVFLVNPNGIAITPTGSVQVGGGFVASTLDISNADFNAGRLNFSGRGASSAVTNAGTISAAPGSFVGLIGGSVASSGTISVPLGKVGLGAGEKVTLNPSGDGFLQVALPSSATTAKGQALIDVAGRIKAAGGSVEIKAATARQAVRDVVNISGMVSARSVSGRRGRIVLDGGDGGEVVVSGRIAANGGKADKAGTIVVTGHKVTLASTAKVSADGAVGGTVLIGGDRHGGDDPASKLVTAPVRTAEDTSIAQGATLSANGNSGDGGNVVVWSDSQTDFRGSITATGNGAGHGGAVEVSSHGLLGFAGTIDVRAANGRTGTLLLDPYDVTISNGVDSNMSSSGNNFSANGNSSVLSVATLQTALLTANVTVDTGSSGTQNGDITVANAVTWATGNSLTLNAAGAINVNAPITATNGSLSLSGSTISVNSTAITLGGTLTASASASGAANAVALDNATISVGGGISTITGATVSGSGIVLSGSLSLSATNGGTFSLAGTSSSNNGVTLAAGAGVTTSGNVSLSGTSSSAVGVYFIGGNTVTDNSGNAVIGGTSSSNQGVWFNSGANTLANAGSGSLTLTGTSSSANGIALNSSVSLLSSGNLSLSGTSASGTGVAFGTSSVFDVSSGNVALSGTSTATSGSGLAVGTSLDAASVSNSGSGSLTIAGTSDDVGGVNAGSAGTLFTGAGTLTNSGGGTLSVSGSNTSGYGVELKGSATLATAGTMSISATSSAGFGLFLAGTNTVTASSGNLSLSGSSSSGAGMRLNSGSAINTGGGTGTVTGTSSSGRGLDFLGNSSLGASGAGTLAASGTSASGAGTELETNASVTSSGTVTLRGTSGSSTGLLLNGGNAVTDSAGGLTLGGTSGSFVGVWFSGGANTLTANGTGLGVAGTSTSNIGVALNSDLTTAGAVSIVGNSTSGNGLWFLGTTITNSSGGLAFSGTSISSNAVWVNGGPLSLINSGSGSYTLSGSSGSSNGIRLNTNAALQTSGDITISGTSTSGSGISAKGGNALTISGGNLTINGTTSSGPAGIDTSSAANTITNSGSGTLTLNGTGGDKLAATISSSSGTLVISDTGAVTQSGGTVTAGNLLLSGAGSFGLDQTNMIGTLAANVGSVSFVNGQNLTIGTVQATPGITASGAATIRSSGNLTLAPGAAVSAASPVLAAAGAFINNAGSSAVTATSGRWLVYSSTPGADTFGGLDSGNTAIWHATYGTVPPASITAGGNRYLFAMQPTLSFTSTDATKTYGTDATTTIASHYGVTGYQSGVAGAFLGDNAASTFTGAPSVTSSGAPATASVIGSPYAINAAQGSLAATSGYAFAFNNSGRLTVNPAPVTVTALGGSSTYGAWPGNPGLSATGLQNGDNASALWGLSNSFGITPFSNAGNYTTRVGGTLLNPNYTLAGSNTGTWTVNPAPVTVTALSGSSLYGLWPSSPGLTATGLQNGQTVGTLTGLFSSFGISGASKPGSYTVGVSGTLTNSNYTLVGTTLGSWSVSLLPGAVTALPAPSTSIAPVVIPTQTASTAAQSALPSATVNNAVAIPAVTPSLSPGASPPASNASANSASRDASVKPASRDAGLNPTRPLLAPQLPAPPASGTPLSGHPLTVSPAPLMTSPAPSPGASPGGAAPAGRATATGCGGKGGAAAGLASGAGGAGASAEGCAASPAASKVASRVVDFALTQLNREALAKAIEQELVETIHGGATPHKVLMVSLAFTSIAFTAGLVGWLLRGGSLVAALLSSIPLWRGFDPLVIVTQSRRSEGRGGSEVDTMFDGARAAAAQPRGLPR